MKTLRNFVLVGSVGCGKSSLMRALLEEGGEVLKTQAVVFHDNNVIDTPGEFIGRRAYFGALISTIMEVQTIVYVQAANSGTFDMPVGLLTVYPHKNIVGVISKVDLPGADIQVAAQLLKNNGIGAPHFPTSAMTGFGIPALRRHLIELSQNDAVRREPLTEGRTTA